MRGFIPEQGHIAYAELSHCMRNDKQASPGSRRNLQVDMGVNKRAGVAHRFVIGLYAKEYVWGRNAGEQRIGRCWWRAGTRFGLVWWGEHGFKDLGHDSRSAGYNNCARMPDIVACH